jgi:hypothetical protein
MQTSTARAATGAAAAIVSPSRKNDHTRVSSGAAGVAEIAEGVRRLRTACDEVLTGSAGGFGP